MKKAMLRKLRVQNEINSVHKIMHDSFVRIAKEKMAKEVKNRKVETKPRKITRKKNK